MAEAATRQFSQSVETWQMRLQVLIQLKRDDVTQCFEEAIKHVKSKVCAGLMDLHVLVFGQKPLMMGCFYVWLRGFVCLFVGFLFIFVGLVFVCFRGGVFFVCLFEDFLFCFCLGLFVCCCC